MLPTDPKNPSKRLNETDAILIWTKLAEGHFPNRVAADQDCNIARVYEILSGKKFPRSKLLAINKLDKVKPRDAQWIRDYRYKPRKPKPPSDTKDLFGDDEED